MFEKCFDEGDFLLNPLLILINIYNIIYCIFIACLYLYQVGCQEQFLDRYAIDGIENL
ncbi:hypothetical protein D1AOALGA4SA_6989 [Olavius algarvensis Delta 1 endosymbiont]|nr:hypothetical protein D1AOALGA4SA_6989 [Olavius algarvensis Delta 1 endosymbiont]